MEKVRGSFFTGLLKKELVTAMGCTEPAAAALTAAAARKALRLFPERALVRASRDIIKNAMHAGIPHTKLKGIQAAVALGLAGGDPAGGLNILAGMGEAEERKAREIMESGMITLELAEGAPPIFIEVRLDAGERHIGARVQNEHDHVEILKGSDYSKPVENRSGENHSPGSGEYTFKEIYEYARDVPFDEIAFLVEGAKTNRELALHSVSTGYGIQVGKTMSETENHLPGPAVIRPDRPSPPDDLFRRGAVLAAAASDARMAGCSMPVVINSGSGNQGITISVPVLVLAEGLGCDEEETARALALAHLTALMMTARKDRLSALCGAFTAAVGTAAGYVRLLKGNYEDQERCFNNMVGNLMGLLCDGAKGSCALKIYSCVEAAAMGARIAMAGRSIPSEEGFLGNNPGETLDLIQKISHEGMIPLDKTVLNIMLEKEHAVY